MNDNLFTFITTCFPVFTSIQTILAFSDGDDSLVTNTIITILAGAVAILWRKIEANYKKLETENNNLKVHLNVAKTRIDECEEDRKDLRQEVENLKNKHLT
jgi:hypothetical protein